MSQIRMGKIETIIQTDSAGVVLAVDAFGQLWEGAIFADVNSGRRMVWKLVRQEITV